MSHGLNRELRSGGTATLARGSRYEVSSVVCGAWAENCYLVLSRRSTQGLLIDPGLDVESILGLVAARRAHVLGILLTHAHYDHIAGLAATAETTGAPVYLHEEDLPLLRSANTFALGWRLPRIRTREPNVLLRGGEELCFEDLRVQVWHLPGHTRGSVGYALGRMLFVGDTILPRNVGRVDLPGGDPRALQDSVRQVISRMDRQTALYPGHGPALDFEALRGHNPFVRPCLEEPRKAGRVP